ncbi:sigma 54-interacting transcriptional regulator [Clostridium sp. MT-14]|uniref:sigma-54 interaction domain-containing protein n=1 Tax=Clostridium sp. MT-14 TaxID=3348360 RepID=UPI00156CD344|nr:Fis family sigma54 specific transcriptional regulator [Clostridiaceae bacterium BL-3]
MMETSFLKQIQPTVIKYANIISKTINVDVEIVDKNFLRIAGTGIYSQKTDEDISTEGYVYNHVLKTGETQVIESPGKNFLCRNCNNRKHCIEKMQVSMPIIYEEKIIGVIGFICSDDEQKQRVKKNIKSYLEILEQISDFIRAKIYAHFENKRNNMMIDLLKQVIDSVNKGVVVLSDNNEIVHMNSSASDQLNIDPEKFKHSIDVTATGEYIAGTEVYTVIVNKKKLYLMGQLIPVYPRLATYDRIFIFDKIKKLKADMYKVAKIREVKADDIIGKSKVMIKLKDRIKKMASSKSTVLITGESGTGKELIAKAIHSEGDRRNKPFIAINCGAIPDNLLESELFGYARGAFSGADPRGRIGKFELANGGIIFLDEIGDMPLYLQVKILRVIQEKKIVRIGSNQLMNLDIRVIAATNRDLKKLIKENKFREDLYYRLNVIPMEVPPLRCRKEDIELLAMNIIGKYNYAFNKSIHGIDSRAKQLLVDYSWPGNVRELENTIEFMMNMAGKSGILTVDMLPETILNYKGQIDEKILAHESIKPLKEVEKKYILKALDLYGSDTKGKQMAANKLGIGIATLYRKLGGIK